MITAHCNPMFCECFCLPHAPRFANAWIDPCLGPRSRPGASAGFQPFATGEPWDLGRTMEYHIFRQDHDENGGYYWYEMSIYSIRTTQGVQLTKIFVFL